MIAITITQELKDLNPDLFKQDVGIIKQLKEIPKSLYSPTYFVGQRTDGYQTLPTATHEADGFYPVVIPTYDTSIEVLGALYFDVDKFTHPVVAKTTEELQQEALSVSESNKQAIIQAETEKQVIATAQSGSDTHALDNTDMFPVWSSEGVTYPLDYKVKSFDGLELKLYKCVQAHTSQAGWEPINVPALFTRVAYPNEILVFVQPTGAQDTYQIGDKVYFPTTDDDIYESLIADNAFSPSAYPAGWQIQ